MFSNHGYLNFHSCAVQPDTIESYMYVTGTQIILPYKMLKFTLKCSYIFRFYNHHQEATIRALLKL